VFDKFPRKGKSPPGGTVFPRGKPNNHVLTGLAGKWKRQPLLGNVKFSAPKLRPKGGEDPLTTTSKRRGKKTLTGKENGGSWTFATTVKF